MVSQNERNLGVEQKANDGTRNGNPSELTFLGIVKEDFQVHGQDFFSQGFWALFWHRFGNWRMSFKTKLVRAPMTLTYLIGSKATEWVCGIFLPYTVVVGRRVKLEHFGGMILVANTIGDDVIIRQNTTFGISNLNALQSRPDIGNGVEIGAGAVIIGGIEIGDNATIGANAVVVDDVPTDTVVGGVPARILRHKGPAR